MRGKVTDGVGKERNKDGWERIDEGGTE